MPQEPRIRERELTLRALATGIAIGAALTPCNVYSGLKIGWSFNMSIVALLLAYGFWVPLVRRAIARSRWLSTDNRSAWTNSNG